MSIVDDLDPGLELRDPHLFYGGTTEEGRLTSTGCKSVKKGIS